jgi:hypothetical protein
MRECLEAKYSTLFASDSTLKPFMISKISHTSLKEITQAASVISSNKGLGIDAIPDLLLKSDSETVMRRITDLVNRFFDRGFIPAPFCYARLHLLNKMKDSTLPGLDDLRPIMITSPIVKIIEAIALRDLKKRLEPEISSCQVGFISEQNTQVHILRLLGRVLTFETVHTSTQEPGPYFSLILSRPLTVWTMKNFFQSWLPPKLNHGRLTYLNSCTTPITSLFLRVNPEELSLEWHKALSSLLCYLTGIWTTSFSP